MNQSKTTLAVKQSVKDNEVEESTAHTVVVSRNTVPLSLSDVNHVVLLTNKN